MNESKECTRCKKWKPLEEFGDHGRWKRGCCRQCHSARLRKWRRDNPHYSTIKRWTGRNQWIDNRAKKLGVPFDLYLHKDELQTRLEKMTCELTGIPLAYQKNDQRLWTSPSLDRIVPERGYVYDNVRVVAFGVNTLLGNWGEEDAYRIARAYVESYVERSVEGV